ncbi:MAG: CPBP family intramembrane metalloprotease [Deltaproteobacteria bacterium]|nr:CPBP family intramembrane metalloprotease [Deltaproteobacteria bacterium]
MENKPSPAGVVRMAVLFYVPMMASGIFVRPPGTFWVQDHRSLLAGCAVALAGGGLVVLASRLLIRRTGWGWSLYSEFRKALGQMSPGHILVLALCSALGEEILFRGVIHPRLGLFWTALLFAGLHFPFKKAMIPWTGFAFLLGLAMGLLTDLSGSLWPVILLHFSINFFNLHDIVDHDIQNPSEQNQQ